MRRAILPGMTSGGTTKLIQETTTKRPVMENKTLTDFSNQFFLMKRQYVLICVDASVDNMCSYASLADHIFWETSGTLKCILCIKCLSTL